MDRTDMLTNIHTDFNTHTQTCTHRICNNSSTSRHLSHSVTDVSVADQQFHGGINDLQHSCELFQHNDAEDTNRVSAGSFLSD